ncbi:uncharacterized protein CLUP02_16926 [Colletotrichum lupini]|uniref:Uncharacterized protein n=1 Tax=Colletotrichum lupini TaxID=145971 RepID=A0A9Q8TB35_9PEZI|nr:uncharacterized protein CLUP02_16926 [Colletotrichum lupini]UQC91391.1 hypothetical protein CLUP02_16926 [Colletotrichum lupini]
MSSSWVVVIQCSVLRGSARVYDSVDERWKMNPVPIWYVTVCPNSANPLGILGLAWSGCWGVGSVADPVCSEGRTAVPAGGDDNMLPGTPSRFGWISFSLRGRAEAAYACAVLCSVLAAAQRYWNLQQQYDASSSELAWLEILSWMKYGVRLRLVINVEYSRSISPHCSTPPTFSKLRIRNYDDRRSACDDQQQAPNESLLDSSPDSWLRKCRLHQVNASILTILQSYFSLILVTGVDLSAIFEPVVISCSSCGYCPKTPSNPVQARQTSTAGDVDIIYPFFRPTKGVPRGEDMRNPNTETPVLLWRRLNLKFEHHVSNKRCPSRRRSEEIRAFARLLQCRTFVGRAVLSSSLHLPWEKPPSKNLNAFDLPLSTWRVGWYPVRAQQSLQSDMNRHFVPPTLWVQWRLLTKSLPMMARAVSVLTFSIFAADTTTWTRSSSLILAKQLCFAKAPRQLGKDCANLLVRSEKMSPDVSQQQASTPGPRTIEFDPALAPGILSE